MAKWYWLVEGGDSHSFIISSENSNNKTLFIAPLVALGVQVRKMSCRVISQNFRLNIQTELEGNRRKTVFQFLLPNILYFVFDIISSRQNDLEWPYICKMAFLLCPTVLRCLCCSLEAWGSMSDKIY